MRRAESKSSQQNSKKIFQKIKVFPPREYDENLGSNYFTNCSKIVYSVFFLYFDSTEENGE